MSYRPSLNGMYDLHSTERISTLLNGIYYIITTNKIVKVIVNFFDIHDFGKKTSCDRKSHLQIKFSTDTESDLAKYQEILADLAIITASTNIDLNTLENRQVFIDNMRFLQKYHTRDYAIAEFIKKFQLAEYCFAFLALLGLAAAIITIAIKKVVGIYLVTYLIWILCCISLFITSKLIICEWKRIRYGGQ